LPAAVTRVIGYDTPEVGVPPGRVESLAFTTSKVPVNPEASAKLFPEALKFVPSGVMLAVAIGMPFHWTWVTVMGLAPSLVTEIHRLGVESVYELMTSFSVFCSEPVSAPAHTATAMPRATATAMSITVAMTGLTALREVICVQHYCKE